MSFLVVISLGMPLMRYVFDHDYVYGLLPLFDRLFDLNTEQNIPTLFSVFLLLCASLLLAAITLINYQRKGPANLHWAGLACGFFFLAIDEGWAIHEMLGLPIRDLLGDGPLGGFYFAWVIPAIGGAIILTLSYKGFLQHLPPPTRLSFLVAGSLYLGGAIGVEMLSARHFELFGPKNLRYALFFHIEESMEMVGIILFIYALLRYIEDQYGRITLLVGDSKPSGALIHLPNSGETNRPHAQRK